MYLEINERFKSQSKLLNNMSVFVGIPTLIFLGWIGFLIGYATNNSLPQWILITYSIFMILFPFMNIYIVVILTIKNEPNFSWKKLWNILYIMDLYNETIHNKDIQTLIEILKDKGVNTRPKVLEVIRHYQCLIPRRTIKGFQIISILAFAFTALALIFSDNIMKSFQNRVIIGVCILCVILVYFFTYFLLKGPLRWFGENALNERIEMAVSEIWMKSLIK